MTQSILALTLVLLSTNNLSGTWTGSLTDAEGGAGGAYLQLHEDGANITGVTGPSKDHTWPIKNAIYTGGHLSFTTTSIDSTSGAQSKWVFDLKVDSDRMTGTAEGSREGQSWKMNMAVTRQK